MDGRGSQGVSEAFLCWSPSGSGSLQDLKPDRGREADVFIDVDLLDGAQVSDAVAVPQQVTVVHSHLKLTAGAQNLYLQHKQTSASSV